MVSPLESLLPGNSDSKVSWDGQETITWEIELPIVTQEQHNLDMI